MYYILDVPSTIQMGRPMWWMTYESSLTSDIAKATIFSDDDIERFFDGYDPCEMWRSPIVPVGAATPPTNWFLQAADLEMEHGV